MSDYWAPPGSMSQTTKSSPNEGDVWDDTTQKGFMVYADGIKQVLAGVIFTATADNSVTNSTSELSALPTGVGTKTLPANFFVVGKAVRIKGGGVFSTAVAAQGTLNVKVKYGSTILSQSTAFTPVANLTTQGFDFEVIIVCRTTGATGTVTTTGGFTYSIGLNLARDVNDLVNSGNTTTIDTTASTALDVTATWGSASSSNIVKTTTCTISVEN